MKYIIETHQWPPLLTWLTRYLQKHISLSTHWKRILDTIYEQSIPFSTRKCPFRTPYGFCDKTVMIACNFTANLSLLYSRHVIWNYRLKREKVQNIYNIYIFTTFLLLSSVFLGVVYRESAFRSGGLFICGESVRSHPGFPRCRKIGYLKNVSISFIAPTPRPRYTICSNLARLPRVERLWDFRALFELPTRDEKTGPAPVISQMFYFHR